VDIKRVPELVPDEVFRKAGGKANQPAPVAQPGDLANYDAIIFGTPRASATWPGRCAIFWISAARCG
jgi:NAD(P)H dehydrogenase (quinone)